jgi:transcription antitermination factor NusG
VSTINIDTEHRPLTAWLPPENSEEVVYLERDGLPRYVLVPLDEGDKEVLAVQKNARLMGYIAECIERGRKEPTKSLAQIKAELLSDESTAKE